MTSPSRGALRWARAGAWTTAALGLTLGAHVVGGGHPPSPLAAGVTAAVLLWLALLLTRVRLGPAGLAGSLTATQLLTHRLLAATEPAHVCTATGAPSAGRHLHEAALACTPAATGVPGVAQTGTAMLLAHAAAAVLTALLLAKGEDAVWVLAGLLRPVWPVWPAPLTLPAAPRALAVPLRPTRPSRRPVLGGVGRRGPPRRRAPQVA